MMRLVTLIIRLLLGAIMLFASISYFFNLGDQPVPTGEMTTIMTGFLATKYLLPLVKITELLVGITLISGKFIKLGIIVLLPISINIFLIHAFISPTELPIAFFVLGANIFLINSYRNSYKNLFIT
jgi:putative oxidoreductase